MTLDALIFEIIAVLLAIKVDSFTTRIYERWKNRKLDIDCDKCHSVAPLAKTPDKLYWLCKTCYIEYVHENFPNMEPDLKRIFRKRRHKK